jgi:4-amino-4-deoxy-L-arabinose transferase-like glycosyltransferase
VDSPNAAEATDIATKQTQSPTIRRLAPWIVLALACLVLYFNCLGSWTFTDPGESYYTEAAREMVESGDWIVPHLNYQIYFSKPILTFWLIAGSYKLFGVSEFAARLPFALIAALMVFATYMASKRLFNQRTALLAALIAASNPLTVVFCKTSPIDLVFCAFLNIAVLGFAMSVFAGSFPWACALWAALGLAVITKGPAGLVFFALGTALFLLLEKPSLKTLWSWFLATRPVIGLLIFFAITVPWYLAVWRATKGLFLEVFINYENFARLAGKTNIHKSRWYFFLPVLAYGFAPWSLILAQTVKVTLGEPFVERWFGTGRLIFKSTYRPHMKVAEDSTKTKPESKLVAKAEIERLTMYYLSCWSLAIFIFFTLSKTQLDTYIQPILTPLAILTAVTVVKLYESQRGEDKKLAEKLNFDAKWLTVFAYICAIFSGLLALVCLVGSVMLYTPAHLGQPALFLLAGILSVVGTVAQFKSLKKNQVIQALIAQALTVSAFTGCILPVVFQLSGQRRQDNMVALARQLQGSKEEIALFGTYMPSAMYYMQRPVDYLSSVTQFSVAKGPISEDGFSYGPTPSGRRQLILSDDKHMEVFKSRPELKLKKLATHGDWGLYDLTNGFAERPRRLEDIFRFLMNSKHSFSDTDSYGPLTVPLGSGDADWFKYRQKKKP